MKSTWYSRNKERAKERQKKWNEKNVERNKERAKKYFQAHKQKYEEQRKRWRKNNPEGVKQQAKRRWQKVKADPEKLLTHNLRVNESAKKRTRKLRVEVLIKYGGNPPKCSCCGEKIIEFLSIDHINSDGKEHRDRMGNNREALFKDLLKRFCPEKYQILCYNCNLAKGFYGTCPHKTLKGSGLGLDNQLK